MSASKIIKDYLVREQIEAPQNICLNSRPGKADIVSIYDTGGEAPDGTGLERSRTVQVVCKYRVGAFLKAEEIFRLINHRAYLVGEVFYIEALQDPFFLGVEDECQMFACNYTCVTKY